MGHITLTFDGIAWRSDRMTEAESVNVIANIRGKFFFAPINFQIEWFEGE